MSDDNKGGNSDLDIFEGLGKKSSPKTSAVPPPPPGSGSQAAAKPAEGLKKTLVGVAPSPMFPPSDAAIPAPPRSVPPPLPASVQASPTSASQPSAPPAASPSGSMRAVNPASQGGPVSKPPPPPGRGSLPNLSSTPSQTGMPAVSASPSTSPSATLKTTSQPPAAASTRPSPAASQVPPAPSTEPQVGAKAKANGGKLDMDWDDDDEATHVFDKDSKDNQKAADAAPEAREPERASMDLIMSQPRPSTIPKQGPAAGTPPPPAANNATLSGAFGALGQPRESTNGSAAPPSLRSGPPPSQSLRAAPPPPPPASMSNPSAPPAAMRAPNPSTSTAPIPPPPPPGQTTTAPMHMPMRQPSQPPHASVPPQPPHASQGSMPAASMPPPQQQVSQPPMPQMPPVSRAMEATAMVPRPQQSKAGLWVALLVGVMAAVGAAVFFLMPRTGTLAVNVADAKGGSVKGLEVQVDGKKCESVPCVMPNVSSGAHIVAVSAPGYESLAPKAVTVESGKTASVDFTLQSAKGGSSAGGTGIKVAGNQAGVRLSVDGKEYGPLPQEIHDLTPGEHKVKISGSERFAPVEKTITVGQDEMVDLGNIQLKVLKGKVTINLGTPGAKVFLVSGTNRKEVPQFPIAIDFDPNEKWNLEAKLAGHDDFTQAITFEDGQAEKTITVTLTPKGSTPAATTPATPAPVAHPVAPPVAAPPVAVAPKEPKAPAEPPAAVAPKEPKEPKAPAPAAGGEAFLNINSLPASTVVLDGKPLGATPRLHVSVSPGTHTVLFVNAEQSLKKSITVTVGAGETKAAFAKLRD
ncbi:MAG: PEGA domain-containing protein [Deltaproteobacteria bacterium]|nr:PEGA domain-containing protein [Deltaproteobacteria bacterium]